MASIFSQETGWIYIGETVNIEYRQNPVNTLEEQIRFVNLYSRFRNGQQVNSSTIFNNDTAKNFAQVNIKSKTGTRELTPTQLGTSQVPAFENSFFCVSHDLIAQEQGTNFFKETQTFRMHTDWKTSSFASQINALGGSSNNGATEWVYVGESVAIEYRQNPEDPTEEQHRIVNYYTIFRVLHDMTKFNSKVGNNYPSGVISSFAGKVRVRPRDLSYPLRGRVYIGFSGFNCISHDVTLLEQGTDKIRETIAFRNETNWVAT